MQFCLVTLEVMMIPTSIMLFVTGTSNCNLTKVAIRITNGAIWSRDLTNPNSRYYKELVSNLTAAVSFKSFAENSVLYFFSQYVSSRYSLDLATVSDWFL